MYIYIVVPPVTPTPDYYVGLYDSGRYLQRFLCKNSDKFKFYIDKPGQKFKSYREAMAAVKSLYRISRVPFSLIPENAQHYRGYFFKVNEDDAKKIIAKMG